MKKHLFILVVCIVGLFFIVRFDSRAGTLPVIKTTDSFQLSQAYLYKNQAVLVGNVSRNGNVLFWYKSGNLFRTSKSYLEGIQGNNVVQAPLHDGFYLNIPESHKGMLLNFDRGTLYPTNQKGAADKVIAKLSQVYKVKVSEQNTFYISDMQQYGKWVSFWIVDGTNEENIKSYAGYYQVTTGKIIAAPEMVLTEYEGKDGRLYVVVQNNEDFSYKVLRYDVSGAKVEGSLPEVSDLFLFELVYVSNGGNQLVVQDISGDLFVVFSKGVSYSAKTFRETVVSTALDNKDGLWVLTDVEGKRFVEQYNGTDFVKRYEVSGEMDVLYVYDAQNLLVGQQYGEKVTRIIGGRYVKLSFVDKEKPGLPTVENVTSISTLVKGKGEEGTTAIVTIGKNSYSTKVSDWGNFAVKIPKQKPGTKLTVVLVDSNKNRSASYSLKVLDKTPPSKPQITTLTRTKISGKGEVNATITATIKGKTYSTKVNAKGIYELKIATQPKGTVVSLYAKDGAGNKSAIVKATIK